MKGGNRIMDKVKTGIYLEKDIHEQFKKIAKQRDIKQNQLFKEMLQAYLKEKEDNRGDN